MPCDLDTIYGQLSQTLPTRSDGSQTLLLSAQTLPAPPLQLTSDRLVITTRVHTHAPSYRADALWFQARPLVYRQLGLLLLSVVFAPAPDRIQLDLTHPASDVTQLLIDYPYRDANLDVGYVPRLYGFSYTPAPAETYRWTQVSQLDPDELPVFSLTSQEAGAVTKRPKRVGDTVAGFGFESATVLLAELLLNIGLPDNPIKEYALEREGEHRGVGGRSSEVRLLLPGSGAWENVL
jgi:hypothetical protein